MGRAAGDFGPGSVGVGPVPLSRSRAAVRPLGILAAFLADRSVFLTVDKIPNSEGQMAVCCSLYGGCWGCLWVLSQQNLPCSVERFRAFSAATSSKSPPLPPFLLDLELSVRRPRPFGDRVRLPFGLSCVLPGVSGANRVVFDGMALGETRTPGRPSRRVPLDGLAFLGFRRLGGDPAWCGVVQLIVTVSSVL